MVSKHLPTNNGDQQKTKGQAIVIVAITFMVLLAFIGLTVDVGQLFIAMGNLRKATDSASLAAAAQFREGRTLAEMEAAALEAISLNGMNPDDVIVEVCDPLNPDLTLCTTPPTKQVRVTASAQVPLSFLSVIGFSTYTISATSTSEAASMDVVLVIDISNSMTYESPIGNPLRDPAFCNAQDPTGADGFPGECQPFEKVKESAIRFLGKILDENPAIEQDRVSIVTFATGWSSDVNLGTHYRYRWVDNGGVMRSISGCDLANAANQGCWTNNAAEAIEIINDLSVFDPGTCSGITDPYTGAVGTTYWGPCRNYDSDGNYAGFYCQSCDDFSPPAQPANLEAWSLAMSTNIGGGLLRAGNKFAFGSREDALWIVVLLTDGMANATFMDSGDNPQNPLTYPIGFCSDDDTYCQDTDVSSRHDSTDPDYDADDYARDMGDFTGCFPDNPAAACTRTGQGAVIFTIGLGPDVLRNNGEVNNLPYGASLLRYVAAVGDDGNPATDPCQDESDFTQWCGNYYYSPSGAELNRVFEAIASRIFTRIRH